MATDALRQQIFPTTRSRPIADRVFFSSMVIVLWATVLYGFARTYFLAGMLAAPLPNRLIHIHGAVFTLWMIVLLVQTSLIAARKVAWHRSLGLFGFALAVVMAVVGILAAIDGLGRHLAPLGLDYKTFFIIPVTDIVFFSLFVSLAYVMRRKPAAHKRLILIATIVIADAAVARWPIAYLQQNPKSQDLVILAFLLAIVVFDLITQKKVLKTTLYASLAVIAMRIVRVPIGFTAPWHAIATHLLPKG